MIILRDGRGLMCGAGIQHFVVRGVVRDGIVEHLEVLIQKWRGVD